MARCEVDQATLRSAVQGRPPVPELPGSGDQHLPDARAEPGDQAQARRTLALRDAAKSLRQVVEREQRILRDLQEGR
jgi:hypothetical protein